MTSARLSQFTLVLHGQIASACGGGNGACSVADTGANADDVPGAVGFPSICPGFEGGACSNALNDCNDVARCLACTTEEATAQAIDLYYGQLVSTDRRTQRALNKCQRAIGTLAVRFAAAKSKALARCWGAVNRGNAAPPCPVPGDGRAFAAIRKAETAFANRLCAACGGHDRECDEAVAMPSGQIFQNGSAIAGSGGSDDLPTGDIGFASTCNSVTVPGGTACDGPVTTLAELVACVSCVTEFTVDCVVLGAAQPFADDPFECRGAATSEPSASATGTPRATPTPTTTATPTTTGTPTQAPSATVTPTPPPGVTATATPTPTPTATQSPIVPQTTWQLWYADSEELATGYHPAPYAFDGDLATFWQSRVEPFPYAPPLPHDLEINLGSLYQMNGFRYLPRQDASSAGRVGQYQLYVSADGATWGSPVASGTFADRVAATEVTFSPFIAQFVRFRALSDLGGSTITNVAELNVLGTCVPPSVTIAPPQDYALQPAPDLAVVANACLDPVLQAGWGVRLGIDGGSAVDDYTPPFARTFPGLTPAEHVASAQLIDTLGTPVGGAAGQAQIAQVGIGNFLVAVGDSITEGLGDNVASDDTSADGRDRSAGYPPILNDLLTTATVGVPHTVVNRSAGGARSAWGAQVMANLVARYPLAQRFLILMGTNDASIFFPIPSGLGLNPGNPGYPGSLKDNLQQMLNAVNTAGKEAILLKVPVTLASCSGCTPYPDPDTGQRNVQLVKPFNQVIDELVADPVNNVSVVPPDLYAYFLQHYSSEYADILHPNGVGYQSVARLVCQAITQTPCTGGP